MSRNRKQRLVLRTETLRRLASRELTGVAGGRIGGRCTLEVSNCGHNPTDDCGTYPCPEE